MTHDPEGPTVILSPHLDDAALSAWHMLPRAVVVTVMAGIPADPTPSVWDRICGYDDAGELMRARRAEDLDALTGIAEEIHHCDVPEQLHRRADPPTAEAVADLAANLVTSGSLCLAPLAGGPRPNPDHRIVRDAARALRRATGIPVSLYADVPYCVKQGSWPESLGGDGPNPQWLNRCWREAPETEGGILAVTRPLDPGEQTDKRALCQKYVTQFTALDRGLRTKGLLSNANTWTRECLIPLH